jgi:hypothetical protein
MQPNLQKSSKVQRQKIETLVELSETCHGCVCLEARTTSDYLLAKCRNKIWEGVRILLIGYYLFKPKNCECKILKKEQNKIKLFFLGAKKCLLMHRC